MCEECDKKDKEIESLEYELEKVKEQSDIFYNALSDIDVITRKAI